MLFLIEESGFLFELYSDYLKLRNQFHTSRKSLLHLTSFDDFNELLVLILDKKDVELIHKEIKNGYMVIDYPKNKLEEKIYQKIKKISSRVNCKLPNLLRLYIIFDEIFDGVFIFKQITVLDKVGLSKDDELNLNEILLDNSFKVKYNTAIKEIEKKIEILSDSLVDPLNQGYKVRGMSINVYCC